MKIQLRYNLGNNQFIREQINPLFQTNKNIMIKINVYIFFHSKIMNVIPTIVSLKKIFLRARFEKMTTVCLCFLAVMKISQQIIRRVSSKFPF